MIFKFSISPTFVPFLLVKVHHPDLHTVSKVVLVARSTEPIAILEV